MVLGTRLFGRIYRKDARPVATLFVHLFHLPLIPLGTHEILDEHEEIASPTRFDAKSLFAGYFKSWGALLAVGLSVWAFVELTTGESQLAYSLPVVSLALMGSVIASWLWLGAPRRVRPAPALALALPLALMTGAYASASCAGYRPVRRSSRSWSCPTRR